MAINRKVNVKKVLCRRFNKIFVEYLRSNVVGGFIDWLRSFSTLLRASLTVSIWPLMLLKNFLFPSSPSSPMRPSAAVWKTLNVESKLTRFGSWGQVTCWNHAGAGWVLGGYVVCLQHLKNHPFSLNTFCPQDTGEYLKLTIFDLKVQENIWSRSLAKRTISECVEVQDALIQSYWRGKCFWDWDWQYICQTTFEQLLARLNFSFYRLVDL